jgi:hypothetical protein
VVKVSIEVCYGATHFRVGVKASSIQRAVDLVKGSYSADDVRVVFPIDPEGFFAEEVFSTEGLIEAGESQRPAA